MPKLASTTAALAVGALTFGLAAPVTAAGIGVKDRRDVCHGVDLRAVHVRNNDKNVRVVLTHTDLRRHPKRAAGGAVFLDTDPRDPGPELVFSGGYSEGTDYMLTRTDGFAVKKWGEPVRGFYVMKLDYRRDKTRMRISRKALGTTGKVRVAVRVSGQRADGSRFVDWLGDRREFTRWVKRG